MAHPRSRWSRRPRGLLLLAAGCLLIALAVGARRSSAPRRIPLLTPAWGTSKLAPSERVYIGTEGGFVVTTSQFFGDHGTQFGVRWLRTGGPGPLPLTVHILDPPEATRARSWAVFLGARRVCWWLRLSAHEAILGTASPLWPAGVGTGLLVLGGVRVAPAVQRLRRARGGRCVECGYQIEGLPTGAACPECGNSPRTPRLN